MKTLPLYLLLSSSAIAAETCDPAQPAACNQETCTPSYCLGPAVTQGNAPVRPYTCDGDVEISASALYWKATQDGMLYAIFSRTNEREFLTPNFEWHPGFKIGVAYNSPCDGWDIGIEWTSYKGKSSNLDQAVTANALGANSSLVTGRDGEVLLVLWTAFQGSLAVFQNPSPLSSFTPFAGELRTDWKSLFNIVDVELGRDFWVSKYLNIRPFLGVRYGTIKQKVEMNIFGGYWAEVDLSVLIMQQPFFQPALTGEVTLHNDFQGAGLVSGMDLNWHLSCGWSLYSNLAAAVLYGIFDVKHDENVREAESPFGKTKVLETTNHFRASRAIADLALGIQWSSLICDCKYGVTAQLGWEQHLYFHQNQMWRVNRELSNGTIPTTGLPNNTGDNDHYQKRGTLSTGGLTFTFKFDF